MSNPLETTHVNLLDADAAAILDDVCRSFERLLAEAESRTVVGLTERVAMLERQVAELRRKVA